MRRSWLVVPAVVVSLARPVLAEEPAAASPAATGAAPAKTDRAVAAQTLFDEGIALMGEGKYAEACVKLEASNRTAWAPGTTINLADCYEKTGRLASAWAKFLEAEPHFRNRTPPDPRADLARQRADALAPRLSRMTIEVAAASKVPGLAVTRDGDPVDAEQWGTGLPVDPGKHVVEASAPGKKPWKWEGEVATDGASVKVEVPALEDAPADVQPPPPAPGGDTGMPLQKKIAIGAGAAGVVGLAIGGIFGGLTLGKVGDANKTCTESAGGTFVCDAAGAALRDEAKGLSTASTVGFIAGGVLAAGGVVLWLTAPGGAPAKEAAGPRKAARVWVAPVVGPVSGLSAGGRF